MALDPLTLSVPLRTPIEQARALPLMWMNLASEGQYGPADHLWHLNRYALALAGRRITRLIVELPPRHGKSTFFSQFFPAWWLGRFPDERVMLTSAVADLAAEWGAKARDALVGYGEPVFGVRVARQYGAARHRWDIEARSGGVYTAGVGGPITGRGADLLIIDDPLKNAEEADSELVRDRQWDWFLSTALPRLQPNAVVIIIMARWHEDDLAGRCLDKLKGWERVRLPAYAEGTDPLGRALGAALWPAQWPLDALQAIESRDERWWNALYMLRPSPPGGVIFHLAWWDSPANRYDPDAIGLPDTPVTVARFLFFDTAFKQGEGNDFTACSVVEVLADYRLRWRQVWIERVEFPDLIDRLVETGSEWNRDGKLYEMVIEDKGSGTSALQTLRKAGPLWLRTKLASFLPTQSKEQRARQAAVWCKKGGVLLPHPRPSVPWLAAFERQIADFPRAVHDDQVDSLSMGVLYLENYLARWERGLSLVGQVV